VKAVLCREFGPADLLDHAEVPDLTPGPGEVLVAVEAAGVNFPDALMVAGTYQVRPELPFIPGSEVCGRVRALGAGVTRFRTGQRVAAFCGTGGYAEQVVVPELMATPLSEEVSAEHGAVLPVAYGTAQHALVDRARLREGESVLVLGAAGGVGLASVQLAKSAGAHVHAVVSSTEKAALVTACGADEVVVVPGGGGLEGLAADLAVDVVVDTVGGRPAEDALRRLAWGGRHLVVGFAGGTIPKVGLNRVLLNEGNIVGVLWGQWARRNPEANAAMMNGLTDLLVSGRITPHLHRAFPLDQAPAALAEVSGRHVLGKVVLRAASTHPSEGN